jgi:hypothetical protein
MRLTCFVQLMGDSGIRPEGDSEYNPNEASLIDRCACGTLKTGTGPCSVSCFFEHIVLLLCARMGLQCSPCSLS